MNQIKQAIQKRGESFAINKDWRYHTTLGHEKFATMFEYGILSKRILSELGIREIGHFDYDSNNGMDRISLSINRGIVGHSYQAFIESNDAVIVDANSPVITHEEYVRKNKGLRALLGKTTIFRYPISSFDDEVQAVDKIPPEDLVGLKIGSYEGLTLSIIESLLENGYDIRLFDFNSLKTMKSSQVYDVVGANTEFQSDETKGHIR